jgi:hypothetical protein
MFPKFADQLLYFEFDICDFILHRFVLGGSEFRQGETIAENDKLAGIAMLIEYNVLKKFATTSKRPSLASVMLLYNTILPQT